MSVCLVVGIVFLLLVVISALALWAACVAGEREDAARQRSFNKWLDEREEERREQD